MACGDGEFVFAEKEKEERQCHKIRALSHLLRIGCLRMTAITESKGFFLAEH